MLIVIDIYTIEILDLLSLRALGQHVSLIHDRRPKSTREGLRTHFMLVFKGENRSGQTRL